MESRIAPGGCSGLSVRRPAGWRAALGRFHRDEQGRVLEYALVLAVLIPMVIFVSAKLFQILADYFGIIAFYASWPFL